MYPFFLSVEVITRRLRQHAVLCLGLWLGACADNPTVEPVLETGASSVSKSRHQQWRCQSDGQQGWDCQPQSAGAAERAAPAIAQQQTAAPTPRATTQPGALPPPRSITQLLLDAPPGAVVIQLVAASQQATLDRFRAARPELPCDQVSVNHGGRRQLLLIMGPYPSSEEAEAIIEVFAPFTDPPWVRPVAALRADLQQ